MITPLEIENKKFSKQMMNGYSVEEVDDFLDELTACYEKLYKESNENQDKIAELNGKLEHYKQIEGTLNNTLIMAQSTAEDIKRTKAKGLENFRIFCFTFYQKCYSTIKCMLQLHYKY